MMKIIYTTITLAALIGLGQVSCKSNYSDGQFLYKTVCANCHMDDGSGLIGLIPPLANSDYLKENQQNLPCIIRHGLKGQINVNGKQFGGQEMTGILVLTDVEITNICNYVNTNFNNNNKVLSLQEVKTTLENCSK